MRLKKVHLVEIILIVMIVIFFFLARSNRNNDEESLETPISSSIENIRLENLDSISGKYSYEDENFTSRFGIDVSTFQGDIDWHKVREDGVEFVFMRIGRRGATTGLIVKDDQFENNYYGAKEAGIPVGVYFFSQAISEREAVLEAKWVINELKDKQIDLPVVYDCEEVFFEDGDESRVLSLSKEEITNNAMAFLETMKVNGYDVMLYTYLNWASEYLEMDKLIDYPIWFAQYDVDLPTLGLPINMWQYSSTGTINGIKGDVDLNIMFIKKD